MYSRKDFEFDMLLVLRRFVDGITRPFGDSRFMHFIGSCHQTFILNKMDDKFDIYSLDYADHDYFKKVRDYLIDTVVPHKIEVYKAGVANLHHFGFTSDELTQFEWNLIVHDFSKFSALEAIGYSQYDFKTKSGDKAMFDLAWHHHKHNNPHHPEYWHSVNRDGTTTVLEMPRIYAAEMVADWIGAGITYGNSIEDWLPSNLHTFKFHPATMEYLKEVFASMGIPVDISDGRLVADYDLGGLKRQF